MIFITTEDLLARFNISFKVSLSYGRKQLSIKIEDEAELCSLIETALNARLSGDSINYELSISECSSKDLSKLGENIYFLLSYLFFESGLTTYSFDEDEGGKKLKEVKENILTQIKNRSIQHELIIAICALDAIFRNDTNLAAELLLFIKNEINLRIALQSFVHFQSGQASEAIAILDKVNKTELQNIFLHLCTNLKAFICIQDGRFDNFKSLEMELESLHSREASHLAPLIQSNLRFLDNYNNGHSLSTDKHYKNVLLYHTSKELDFFDNLKSGVRRLTSDEVYENMEVYGKETIRFNNTPHSISQRLFRFIFLYSFMGSHSGFSEGSKLFFQSFFTLGDMYKDQSLYREALRNAIRIGSQKDIEKIVKTPAFIKNAEAISFMEKLISANPYQGPTAIGISYLIKNIYPFISEKLAPFIVRHLKKEIHNNFSFTSDFDHARPALEALYFAAHTLPKDQSIDLLQSFVAAIKKIPLNMIGMDTINKVVNNLPKDVIQENSQSVESLISFYFKNIESSLKMHYESTLLSVSWLIQNSKNVGAKNTFLEIINKELSLSKENASKTIFLLSRVQDVEGSLSQDEISSVANLVIDEILNPASKGYSTEGYGGYDSLLISTRFFDSFPKNLQDKYLDKIVSCLLDPKSSISNKIRYIQTLDFLSKRIDEKYFKSLGNFIVQNRKTLFASSRKEDLSPFRSSSFVNFRALLYSCAIVAPVDNPTMFSLDLLRLSVSTESHVRESFAESTVYFIRANPNYSGNLSLLNRCYELTFDSDPKVRGVAISSVVELFTTIDQEIKDSYLMRIIDLASDPSEITRAYLARAFNKFKSNVPSEQFDSLKNKLEKDVSFYVRRNINKTNEDE